MAKIHINNPKQVINGGAKKYYFKVKGLGGPKGDKGDKGDTGATGPQGPQGNAATVSVGTTTTLPVGQDATVQNVGTLYNAVLNFGIPQGPRGPQGATGAKGDKGDKGEQGNPGPQGEKGTNATVTVGTTTTTEPGTQAYAWNSSSNPNNAVINFNIPRGATGSQGPQGIQGPTGPAGADGQDGQNFTPTIVDTLPAVGDQSNLYLTPKAHTTSTATGNPIEATITEQAGQIESFQLDGDTEQATYTGKNLIGFGTYSYEKSGITCTTSPDGTITLNGTRTGTTTGAIIFGTNSPKFNLSGTFTMTIIILSGSFSGANIGYNATDENEYQRFYQVYGSNGIYNQGTITPTQAQLDAITGINVLIGSGASTFDNLKFKIQVTAGENHDSDYEPYVGGQPSPNPDYPQPIQTVTGEQTVSVNGTDYPLDLGSIELCNIGGYQDYIHKVGEDWIITKRTTSILLNEYSSIYRGNFGTNPFYTVLPQGSGGAENTKNVISDYFYGIPYTDRTLEVPNSIFNTFIDNTPVLYIRNTPWATIEDFKSWLSEHNVKVYSKRTTTDTTITDTTLIAQLEAIRTASLENGTNTITNTATGTNLAGDMEIGYFGFNPTNRYDKFIWLDLNNNYEQIGGE